jgi:ABC-type oligopeptide transport system ATPase subunit
MAIVVVIGGSLVLDQSLEVGVMVAFLFYIQRFFDPIRSLTMQYSVLQRAMASGQRLTEVLDVPLHIQDSENAIALAPDTDGSISFQNVSFGYDPKFPILENISFEVKPGQTVALVGPTGSGKSSAVALVHRFYDVQEGQVIVGGHDVRALTQESLGQQIAMVLQEPYLFTGTIEENIRYNKDSATRADVIAAATAVGNIAIVGDNTWVATTSGRVYYSPDKGKTWEVFITPIIKEKETEGIYSIDFYDELNGFAIGGDYTKPDDNIANKIRTNDGGKTWELVAQNQNPGYRSCIQYIPNRNGKELIAIGFKGIDYSNDSGSTWKHLSDENFFTIRFLNDSIAYAAGAGRISKLTFRE